MSAPWTVAFYRLDRCYGGGEEGGWWFDTGDLERPAKRTFATEDEACIYSSRVNRLLRLIQRHKRSIGSMGYNGGRYGASVYEGPPPSFYPPHQPFYE
jgi:hypothetical protein